MDDLSQFRQGMKALSLQIDERMQEKLIQHADLIREWNRRVNLISRQDEDRILSHHVLDSLYLLQAAEIATGACVLDLGSGAGFPGIPMTLVRPDLTMLLVESKRKKVLFLQKAIAMLSLLRCKAILGRIEALSTTVPKVDIVVSRAVADLSTLIDWSRPLFQRHPGRLVTIKGPESEEEILRMKETGRYPEITTLKVRPLYPDGSEKRNRDSRVMEIQLVGIK
jgi:16S rRNA (guanine527-N7)-methyltransferase